MSITDPTEDAFLAGRDRERRDRLAKLAEQHLSDADAEQLLEEDSAQPLGRYAGITDHAGDKGLFVMDTPGAVAREMAQLLTQDTPDVPLALVDLDTGERYEAHTDVTVTFPALPNDC